MRKQPPVQMIDGNLIACQDLDDVWAVFFLPGRSYRAESRAQQAHLAGALERYAKEAKANFQILVVTSRWNAEDYVAQMRAHMPARAHSEFYDAFLVEQQAQIAGMQARSARTALCVRLAGHEQDAAAQASKLFERSREHWKRDSREVVERWRRRKRALAENSLRLTGNEVREQSAFRTVQSCFPGARRASMLEIQWLLRRMFSRGVAEPVLSPIQTEFRSPYEARTVVTNWLQDYLVDREHGTLKVKYPGGECFQAPICAGTIDDSEPFSRASELMFTAIERPYPVDACLNVRWFPNSYARRKAENRYKQLANEHLDESGGALGAMHPSLERTQLAHEYHARLAKSGDPELGGTLSYLLSADTRDELEARVEDFRHSFPHNACHRPLIDPLQAFSSHWPGQRAHIRDFERLYTPEQVGAMVPHAAHDSGSQKPEAFYYAKTLDGAQPIRFDLREASDTNGAPLIAIVASLGGGKTMLGQLFFYHAFLRGAWVVDIDPKGDHRWHEMPEVAPHTRVIEIGDEERYRGMLDPLRVALPSERQMAAATFLIEVIGSRDEMVHAGINGAVGRVIEALGERACCSEVVRALKESDQPEFARAGLELEQYMHAGIVRLGFAAVDDPIRTRAESQVTVIRSRVLQNVGTGELATQAQRHSRAILQQIIYQGRKLLGAERAIHKVMGFDETGFMAGDALARQFISQCAVWSRSDLLTPILMSQDPADVRGQRNKIGQWFVGRMKSRDHVCEVLAELELETDGPLTRRILAFPEGGGQFLKKDLAGRSELVQVDPGARLVAALKTTPEEEQLANKEEVAYA